MGKETDYVRRLKANSPATVRFLAYRSGKALGDLFREADMFCSPSVWEEPFGLVNVEALASGLPVVSTRGGGTREIFAGGGGILVERGSAAELAMRCAGWRRIQSCGRALASRAMRHFSNDSPGRTRAPRCSRSRKRSPLDLLG